MYSGPDCCLGTATFDEPFCCPLIPGPDFMGLSICQGSCPADGQTLMASATCDAGSPTYIWYDVATGGTPIATGATFDPFALGLVDNDVPGDYVFYVSVNCGISICESERTKATVSILECNIPCLLYTSPSPRDQRGSRMPSSA